MNALLFVFLWVAAALTVLGVAMYVTRDKDAKPTYKGSLDGGAKIVAEAVTNADGRCDRPLVDGSAFVTGQYEITFRVGDYFRAQGVALPEPPFLDVVPVRFGVAEDGHYHVPLLVSPYGYSTYRGS